MGKQSKVKSFRKQPRYARAGLLTSLFRFAPSGANARLHFEQLGRCQFVVHGVVILLSSNFISVVGRMTLLVLWFVGGASGTDIRLHFEKLCCIRFAFHVNCLHLDMRRNAAILLIHLKNIFGGCLGWVRTGRQGRLLNGPGDSRPPGNTAAGSMRSSTQHPCSSRRVRVRRVPGSRSRGMRPSGSRQAPWIDATRGSRDGRR